MRVTLLLAHPDPESLNAALAEKARKSLEAAGHQVCFHDLYREGFDPLLSVEELSDTWEPEGLMKTHCEEIAAADGIVIVHPNYRNQPPAILKGWVDRVIRSGVAFRFTGDEGEEGEEQGLLRAHKALVISTADCPEEVDRNEGFPIARFWDNYVFSGCGVGETSFHCFYQVLFSTPDLRSRWLDQVGELVGQLFQGPAGPVRV